MIHERVLQIPLNRDIAGVSQCVGQARAIARIAGVGGKYGASQPPRFLHVHSRALRTVHY